jgi:hypothetical protein
MATVPSFSRASSASRTGDRLKILGKPALAGDLAGEELPLAVFDHHG